MSSSVPQFDSAFFAPQLFWLTITYVSFYFLLSKVIIPRIKAIQEKREISIDGSVKEVENIERASDLLLEKRKKQLSIAQNESYRLISGARSSLQLAADAAYKDVSREFEQETVMINTKLHKLFKEQLMKHEDSAYEIVLAVLQEIYPDLKKSVDEIKNEFNADNKNRGTHREK